MKKILIFIFLVLFCSDQVLAGDLNYSEQIEYEEGFFKMCFETQRKKKINEGLKDWQLKEYCKCMARKISHSVTYDELTHVMKNRNPPESYVKKVKKAGDECIEHLFKKWGFGK